MADQQGVLANLAALIDSVLPGTRRYAPVVSHTGGFAIAVPGGGQVLVWSAPAKPWFLDFTAGIARDVSDLGAALSWVNEKNSSFNFGRFYASIPADAAERANVVYKDSIFSGLFDQAPQVLTGFVQDVLKLSTEVARGEPQGFVQVVGGVPFADTDDDRNVLVAAAMG
jgi:hypothetical protein